MEASSASRATFPVSIPAWAAWRSCVAADGQREVSFSNRQDTISGVVDGTRTTEIPLPLHVVPLSPSSGQNIRTHIRSKLNDQTTNAHASLRDALKSQALVGGSIVFVDDNIASGTQAARQINIYFGTESARAGGKYFSDPLSEDERHQLAGGEIGAVFVVGHTDGMQRLVQACSALGVQMSAGNIWSKREIAEVSGKDVISNELRVFLRRIGRSVLTRRFSREGTKDAEELARRHSLGYDGLEGLLATSFSVPTSTYPALWCPGTWTSNNGADASPAIELPWIPLFIRTNMLQHLVD